MADTEDLEQAERSPRTQVPIRLQNNDSRLSIPFGVRLPATATLSFLIGAGLGVSHGSQVAAYRFRAENAHRLPTSPTGWYLYHKSKNYRMAYAGIGEAFKMGAKLSIWTSTFFAIEGLLDSQLMRKDFTNTVVASLTTAGLFSAWNRFTLPMAARMSKTGLAVGLVYGLAQDAVGAARGRVPGYVEFIQRRTGRPTNSPQAQGEDAGY